MLLCYWAVYTCNCNEVYAQQSIIKGTVSIHNSETNTGRRQYVTNAQVEDKGNRATPTITNANGEFKLIYVGAGENKPVSFSVVKQGLQVVDPARLSAITGQDLIIEVSMANADSLTAYRVKLFNIGKTEMEKKLEGLLRGKNQQLLALKKQGAQNAARVTGLQFELDSIYQKINEQAAAFANHFSQLNLDDVSAQFRLAFAHFEKGNTDLALTVLSRMNLYHAAETLAAERKKLSAGDTTGQRLVRDACDALALKAELHKTLFEFDSAVVCLEYALQLEPLNEAYLINAADLLPDLGRNQDARIYYNRALTIYRKRAVTNPEIYLPKMAHTLRQLGTYAFFWDTGVDERDERFDFEKSTAAYRDAIAIYRSLAAKDASTWLPDLAATVLDLASRVLYYPENNFHLTEAEPLYQEAINIYEKLAKEDNQTYEPLLARAERSSGQFYAKILEFTNAEKMIAAARVRYQRLAANKSYAAASDNLNYCEEIAQEIATAKAAFSEPEISLLEKLEKYRLMAKTGPDSLEELTATLAQLGELLPRSEARVILVEAVNNYRKLAVKQPNNYRPKLAKTLATLGQRFEESYLYLEARLCYLEAAELYTQLLKNKPNPSAAVATTLRERADQLSIDEHNFMFASDPSLIWGIDVYLQLVKATPGLYNGTLAALQAGLALKYVSHAWFSLMEGNFVAAEAMSGQAKEIAENIPAPDADLLPLISTNLAHALLYQGKYKQALDIYAYLKKRVSESGKSFVAICLEDLDAMEKKNITHVDVARVRRFLIE